MTGGDARSRESPDELSRGGESAGDLPLDAGRASCISAGIGTKSAAGRRAVVRQSLSVALATGLYGVSFGALAVTSGLTVWQACVTSLLLFSGGSQFALLGVLAGGGSVGSAIAASSLLGIRNTLYGLQLNAILRPRGWKRFAAAQITIDESTAVAVSQSERKHQRLGFWVTGITIYLGWNIMTLVGALVGNTIGDPKQYGLDAAASGAFLALLWPRLRAKEPVAVAIVAAFVAVLLVPVVPVGLPVIAASLVAVVFGYIVHRRSPETPGAGPSGTPPRSHDGEVPQ